MPKLFYKDLWGKRADKYKFLESNDISTVNWQELNSLEPYHFFVPKDFSLKEEYEKFWSVKDIFIQFSSGVKTHRDHFIVGFTKEEVANKIRIFTGTLDDETVVDLHLLKDTQAKAFGHPYPESKSEISNLQSTITVGYPVQGTDKVEKIKYLNGRVYINKEQYFENIIEDVWNYHIGSYKVMEKFLKDRKGRRLSLDEIQRYLKIISSIAQTIEIQKEVDRIWQT